MDTIRGETESPARDDAWVSGLSNWAIGGSTDGKGDMGTACGKRWGGWSGGTEGWEPRSLNRQLLLCRNESSAFSEVRNPDFSLKALSFYTSAINSNLKCPVRANSMQAK